jgi:hypothetical protein
MADAAASKAAEATHVGSTPTFPTMSSAEFPRKKARHDARDARMAHKWLTRLAKAVAALALGVALPRGACLSQCSVEPRCC